VAFRHAEVIEHAQHVGDVVVEGERAVVVFAAAVAARVPGDAREAPGEHLQLAAPVRAVAADAVHEEHELAPAVAGEVEGEGRGSGKSGEAHGGQSPR